jgi:hypothetical protein
VDIYTQRLLALADRLAAEADPLPPGDCRRAELVGQIEALNKAITLFGKD